jgi:hypothetical protein
MQGSNDARRVELMGEEGKRDILYERKMNSTRDLGH